MAISQTEQVDALWKRIIFGVSKTASSLIKFASNETIPSALPVFPSSIWADAASIPVPAPATTGAVVQVFTGTQRIQMTNDPTSTANISWMAATTLGQTNTRMGDFVPSSVDATYAVQVYIGDPNVGPAARIFPDTTGEEFVFDYSAGVLTFYTAVPANKPASIGSGIVSVASNGIYIEAYRYIGSKGLGSAMNELGTMSQQNADEVAITGGTISNVILTNCTIDAGTF